MFAELFPGTSKHLANYHFVGHLINFVWSRRSLEIHYNTFFKSKFSVNMPDNATSFGQFCYDIGF